MKSLKPRKINKHHTFVLMGECMLVCLLVWMWMQGRGVGGVCVCAHVVLLIQHAKRMRHICGFPPYFPSLSHKRQDFRKNVTEYKMRVFIFSTILFGTVLILRRIKRDIVKNMKTSSCKVPVILVGF
jgi:hypothetical protein